MVYKFYKYPRKFSVKNIEIKDYGKLFLESNEMISIITDKNNECDITAFEWGFYLGSSLNFRMKQEGFKIALVINEQDRIYINAVRVDKIEEFKKYLTTNQKSKILCWLDEFLKSEYQVKIIAEIGINFNSEINLAKKLIDIASNAGCDFAKFSLQP